MWSNSETQLYYDPNPCCPEAEWVKVGSVHGRMENKEQLEMLTGCMGKELEIERRAGNGDWGGAGDIEMHGVEMHKLMPPPPPPPPLKTLLTYNGFILSRVVVLQVTSLSWQEVSCLYPDMAYRKLIPCPGKR